MSKLLINSVYLATEGEGVHIGRPQIFVRFQGCNVGCVNCDSKETWDFDESYEMSFQELLAKIEKVNLGGKIRNISITGGDPLHPKNAPHVLKLVKHLKAKNYYINIEAAGIRLNHEIFDCVDYISFDYKTPSTSVKYNEAILERFVRQYRGKSQIKAVITDKRDFDAIYEICVRLERFGGPEVLWVLTPAYEPSEDFPRERIIDILKWNCETGGKFRVIAQQHKWFFGAKERLV